MKKSRSEYYYVHRTRLLHLLAFYKQATRDLRLQNEQLRRQPNLPLPPCGIDPKKHAENTTHRPPLVLAEEIDEIDESLHPTPEKSTFTDPIDVIDPIEEVGESDFAVATAPSQPTRRQLSVVFTSKK